MRRGMSLLLSFVFAVLAGGCAFVNVDVMPSPSPLQERVVEGEGKGKILIIDITGMISEKEKSGGQLFGSNPSMVTYIKESLQKAERDDELAGVILRINSPGGTVTASDIIYHEIVKFREKKKVPVAACIIGLGASGGYYVASAADEIVIHPTAVTGSIGVMVMTFNVEGLLAKVGVSEYTVKSADKKDFMSPFRAATEEELKIMQTIIDSMYGRFIEVINSRPGNSLEPEQIRTLADGRIYTAQQAVTAKLVDRIAYLDDLVLDMKKRGGKPDAKVITYHRRGDSKETIYSQAPGGAPQINLININADWLEMVPSTEFLYLWKQ